MDWTPLELSLRLALWTCALLIPLAAICARWLAWSRWRGKVLLEALVALPLVLPPTVLGYYLLLSLGGDSLLGGWYQSLVGRQLVFNFDGLLVAAIIFNLPFAVQPLQRAFEGVPQDVREAAWCAGLSAWRTFWKVELPLAWPGLVTALTLSFVHTLGEFGVVLMVGGSIPAKTQTLSIAIYDRVQAFDDAGAGRMSAILLGIAFSAVVLVYLLSRRGTALGR